MSPKIFLLAAINYRGARHGALVSDLFVLAKLVPRAVFVPAGLFFLQSRLMLMGLAWIGGVRLIE